MFDVRTIDVDGLAMEVATAGTGPAVLLLHGIPHTWFVWRNVMTALAPRHRVIAPDLRGLGGTARAKSGFDVITVASDLAKLLDVLGVAHTSVVGLDLGVQVAFVLALRSPRVRRVAMMEGLVGSLPGAEQFLARGAPWWFGFHAVPSLPEAMITGRESTYLDFFLANGTHARRGVAPDAREAFVRAYTGHESIRAMCDHYRAMPESARQITELVRASRLEIPALAIAGGVVGDALAGQLRPVTSRLETATLADAAHILPEDQPETLSALLETFLSRQFPIAIS